MEENKKSHQNKDQSLDNRKIGRREVLKRLAVLPLVGPAIYGNFKKEAFHVILAGDHLAFIFRFYL